MAVAFTRNQTNHLDSEDRAHIEIDSIFFLVHFWSHDPILPRPWSWWTTHLQAVPLEIPMKLYQLAYCVLAILLAGPVAAQYDSGRAELSVIVNNEIYPYREFAVYVLPAEHLDLCVIALNPDTVAIQADGGALDKIEGCRWIWTAPEEPGLTQLRIADSGSTQMTLSVFVMVPANRVRRGSLEGYAIGEYPAPLDDSPIYLPPDGFIRVTEEVLGVNVSPNFKLGQFVEQRNEGFPKFIVLRERLLLKLEELLEDLNDRGVPAESLSIVRGYITPLRNSDLGNSRDSRHIYGGAVTFIVDRDGDGRMDDIDGNGVLNRADGVALFEIIDELFSRPGKEYLKGGLFLYDDVSRNTTLVMMDARGFRKRWENDSAVPELPAELRPKHKRHFE